MVTMNVQINKWAYSFLVTFDACDIQNRLVGAGILSRHLHLALRLNLVDDVTEYTRCNLDGPVYLAHMLLYAEEVNLGRAKYNVNRGVAW